MAITIDWQSKIINVPKADLTLIQSTPVEIRELNLNSFRLTLKDLEDDEAGMVHLDTHSHNTEVLLGGIVYARVIEIINGYTITFEDGQYSINLVGANSNVGDVVNPNQVSIRSANSAGLISNSAIEFSSFSDAVTIDKDNVTGYSTDGTIFPTGTRQTPVDNLPDLHLIASTRGLNRIKIIGNIMLSNEADWNRFEFIGESATKTLITINPEATVSNCEFYDAIVTGTLDGNSHIERCVITNLNVIDGFVFQCAIGNTITLAPNVIANIFSCFSTVPGVETPEINLGGSGVLAVRDYNGGMLLSNYGGSGSHSIDLSSGQVKLASSISGGTFVFRGVGKLIEEDTGNPISSGIWNSGVTIVNELLNSASINTILDYANADEVKEADGTLTKYKSGTNEVLGDAKTIIENCDTGEASIIKKV